MNKKISKININDHYSSVLSAESQLRHIEKQGGEKYIIRIIN